MIYFCFVIIDAKNVWYLDKATQSHRGLNVPSLTVKDAACLYADPRAQINWTLMKMNDTVYRDVVDHWAG